MINNNDDKKQYHEINTPICRNTKHFDRYTGFRKSYIL